MTPRLNLIAGRPITSVWLIVALTVLAAWMAPLGRTAEPVESPHQHPAYPPKPHFSDALFHPPRCLSLQLVLPADSMRSLHNRPKSYVQGTLQYQKQQLGQVAVKLKGGTDSFEPIDGKPSFTLNLDRYRQGQNLFGLDKIHLNNSRQDPSYMRECLASWIFAEAGIPVTRTAFATVSLNGRNLGLYVLKESYDKTFLKRHFAEASGNLYEGEHGTDITGHLARQSGEGPNDQSDLKRLAAACRERDTSLRLQSLERLMDVDSFRTLSAIETLLGHWNGYTYRANNYRLYANPADDRLVFLPAGLETSFPSEPLNRDNAVVGIVAAALIPLKNPHTDQDHHIGVMAERLRIHTEVPKRIEAVTNTILAELSRLSPTEARSAQDAIQTLLTRYNDILAAN